MPLIPVHTGMADGDGWFWLLIAFAGLAVAINLFRGSQPSPTLGVKASPVQTMENEETWEWIDWEGNKRSIEIHRTVKTNDGSQG